MSKRAKSWAAVMMGGYSEKNLTKTQRSAIDRFVKAQAESKEHARALRRSLTALAHEAPSDFRTIVS